MSNILKIYTVNEKEGKEILRKKSRDVLDKEIKDSKFQSFLDDLIHTAKTVVTEEGYIAAGLSAIQVGSDLRVFCILKEDSGKFDIMINPSIDILNPIQIVGLEACLSIPKKEGKVARFKKIRVTYLDRKGNRKRKNFSNFEAREMQHEYDHLEGILFTDKLID